MAVAWGFSARDAAVVFDCIVRRHHVAGVYAIDVQAGVRSAWNGLVVRCMYRCDMDMACMVLLVCNGVRSDGFMEFSHEIV